MQRKVRRAPASRLRAMSVAPITPLARPTGGPPAGDDVSGSRRAAPAPASQQAWLRLSGLRCAACGGLIEAAITAVDGVLDAQVHGPAQQARARYDPSRTNVPALIDAVRRAGYDAVPDEPCAARDQRRAERRIALWRLFVAGFCAMQVMMLATPAYVSAPGELAPDLRRLLDWGGWLLSIPVLLFSAAPFFAGAWHALRQGRIGMDVPVAIGIAVTFVASSGAAFDPGGPFGDAVYFDSLTMFVSFLLLGRWLELGMRHRAAEALEAAVGAMPLTALRLLPDGTARAVPIGELEPGARVRVPAGEAFPADGHLIDGRSTVDESLLSGESRPVRKAIGSGVVGGSINLGAPVVMQVERCGTDTRYEAIVALMRDAAVQRPAAARWADRWAAPFLWTVLLLAAGAGAVWSVIDPPRAVWVVVSVLIVTCPCALALATPSALLATAQAMARRGVLVRRIDALTHLAGIGRLFIDKTGTLTLRQLALRGTTRLPAVNGENGESFVNDVEWLQRAVSLAAYSTHPLSRALVAAAPPAGGAFVWRAVREQAGAGIEARDEDGRLWRLGAAAWVGGASGPADHEHMAACIGHDGRALARFDFDETLAEGAAEAVRALQADGVALTLLSGDTPARVCRLAQRLGIDAADAIGGASPEDKLRYIEMAQSRGECVGMVGDGINDAPVLARADVSLAMGEGALVARANADAVIISNRLGDVVFARRIAGRMLRVIRQNLAWAAAYNLLCVPLALLGALPPWAAGLGMAASSLVVVGNSLRLKR